MGETIRVMTPEQVELSYEVAGIGSRFLAGLIDGLIQAGFLLLGFIVALIFGAGARFTVELSLIIGLLTLYTFVVFWSYFVYFETRWNGQTPGKRALGLRVIRDSGHPIDFRTSFIRNIVRVVDMLPGMYGIGLITMFISPHWKRLGDHVAGTVVVKERAAPAPASSVSWDRKEFFILNDQALVRIMTLTREDYETIRRFFERRPDLDFLTAERLAREIASPLMMQLGVQLPPINPQYERFLEEVARAYERQRGR